MVTPEHVQQVVSAYCTAESAKDRDRWLSLFAPEATHEDPVGAPVNRGLDAIGAFFDAGAGQMDLHLHATAPAIVVGDEALVFLAVHIGHGADRLLLSPIVDHMVFDDQGRIAALRAFFDPAGIAPDPRVNPPDDTYTHGHHESVLRSHRWRTAENSAGYLLDALTPGTRVLDVGCGPGTITIDVAQRVAPAEVVGIDREADVLEGARDAARGAGVDTVSFDVGDVYALAFPDASFDVVHAHQVLQHLTDPVAALREMRRVCAPDGVVAARDSDYAAFTWFPDDTRLTRWLELYHEVARSNDAEPDAGRHLLQWARAAGFRDVSATASVWCFANDSDREWWGGMWADRVVSSAFAAQAVDRGFAMRDDLEAMSEAWRAWSTSPDGWFAILHGEILATP